VIGGGQSPTAICAYCGGEGVRLDPSIDVCPQCRWLRPLAPGYVVHPNAFQWGADSQAMAKLRALGPLNAAARAVSDRVGRRWVESSFNAVRLGDNQLPDVFAMAIRAARLLGMPYMPDVYISGDKMWDAVTYGTDRSAFLLIGSALVNNFKGDDLLFLLAREMGHCRAGHALWKTVGMFLVGQQPQRKGMMSEGILGALNIEHLLQSALDVPFLMWARQAEITADRAGLLAVGNEEVARRVLLAWSLRSMPLYQQINIDAWLQQQEDSDDQMTRLSEMVNSPTPFITRRLKLLTDYARSPDLFNIRAVIAPLDMAVYPPAGQALNMEPPLLQAPPPMVELGTPDPAVESALPADDTASTAEFVRIACTNCGTGMRVPREKLAGKTEFKVRCPNSACGLVMTLRKKTAALAAAERTESDE
jgi:Zn-dependent protease with chaperone function